MGATCCLLLSDAAGARLVHKYLSARIDRWSRQVQAHHSNLLYYMLFLRISPIVPNWFINLSGKSSAGFYYARTYRNLAPHIDFPFRTFVLGTFVGVMPPVYLHAQAGRTLQNLIDEDPNGAIRLNMSWQIFVLLLLGVASAILPLAVKRILASRFA